MSQPNCLIFHGIEEFLRAEALAELKAQLGEPSLVAMNTTVLDGKRATMAEIARAAEALPFLGAARLVIVEGLLKRLLGGRGGVAKKADQQLAADLSEYLARVPPGTVLVLVEEEPMPENHPVLQAARRQADRIAVRAFGALSEPDLRRWLAERARLHGGALAPDALARLALLGDANLRLLDQEVRKLLAYADGRPATAADVERLVPAARAVDIFAMVDALGQRNERKALEQFHALVRDGEPPVRLLVMIARQFRMILQMQELIARRAPPAEQMRTLGVARFVADKVQAQARQFTPAQARRIYRRLLETDQSIKTGQTDPLLALDALLAEILARAPAKR